MAMFDLHSSYPYFEEVNDGVMHAISQLEVTPQTKCLDVGCGRGVLGEAIQKKIEVWGIESHSDAVQDAQGRITRVIQEDLTDTQAVKRKIGNEKFDFIIFSDVLEHVVDPLEVLKSYRNFLSEKGKVIISLPNLGNWESRLRLMMGQFNYSDSGVMDRTHLRFFTFRTAKLLVKESDLDIKFKAATPYLVRAFLPIIRAFFSRNAHASRTIQTSIVDSKSFRLYQKWIYPFESFICNLWPQLLAFRIILVAERPDTLRRQSGPR